jgi:hypothetical protein
LIIRHRVMIGCAAAAGDREGGRGSCRILRMRRCRSGVAVVVGRRDVVAVEERREDVSLCHNVNAVWERERRLDARSARPFLQG